MDRTKIDTSNMLENSRRFQKNVENICVSSVVLNMKSHCNETIENRYIFDNTKILFLLFFKYSLLETFSQRGWGSSGAFLVRLKWCK